MSAYVIDSAASIARARADLSRSLLPQGRCLANVYRWMLNGRSSTGPGAGKFATAMDGWNYAVRKHAGDTNVPAGVAVYFGVSPTRTDRNKNAGDVGLSIGGGLAIFTDASGSRVGIMTLRARAVQTQRPYLGWTEDFLGYDTSAAAGIVPPVVTTSGPIVAQNDEDSMRVMADVRTNLWWWGMPGHFGRVPEGKGGDYLAQAGQGDVLRVDTDQINTWSDFYRQRQRGGLFAITDGKNKDRWYVLDEGAAFEVNPNDVPLYEEIYGHRQQIDSRRFNIRAATLGQALRV